mmetsp:Transcript_7249/g.11396  ORF Transcript_7249/g.11396 Transcript_7249/m.11396 type:complete len:237 (+) Transcript_7249:2582-3292(+)
MAEGGGKGQAVEHLRHPRAGVLRTLCAPVARGKGVLKPRCDGLGLDRECQLDVLPTVHTPLAVQAHVLAQLPKQLPEQHADEGPREVHALVAEMVAIVLVAAAQRAQQQPVHNISHVVRFFRLAILIHAHVRQELLLQDLLGVLDALLARHPHGTPALADVVQRDRLRLDDESLLNGRAQQLHHLVVVEVIHHMLEDVFVGHKAERAKHHKQGDVGADVWQGDSNHARFHLGPRAV